MVAARVIDEGKWDEFEKIEDQIKKEISEL